ncbi:hypothetical protein D3C86_1345560 [compost metagenome]
MGAKNTIDHDLQYFNIDDDKTCVNNQVKKSRDRTEKHFCLSECHFEHGHEPFLRLV